MISGTNNHLKIARVAAGARRDPGRRQDAEDDEPALVRRRHASSRGPRRARSSCRASTTTKPRSITPKPEEPAGRVPVPRTAESFSVGAFSRDNTRIVLTSRKGWYVASVADGDARARVHARRQERGEEPARVGPRLDARQATRCSCSSASPIAGTAASCASICRRKQLTPLVKDRNLYQNVRYSRDGSTVVYHDVGRRSSGRSLRRRRRLPQSAQADRRSIRGWPARRCRRPSSSPIATPTARRSTACCAIRWATRRAGSIRRSSRSTRRSSTTASTAARRFSPITATPSSTRR